MSKNGWVAAIVAAPLLLSGCGSTRNVQTVKSADYTDKPHSLAAIVESPSLDPRFNAAFVDSASRCGVQVSFVKPVPGQTTNVGTVDGVLVIHELGHETTTMTRYGYPVGQPWTSMVRLQFSLTDAKSKKPVWKGQADFNVGQFSGVHENDPTQRWGDDLAGMMQKDNIFGDCNFKRGPAKVPANF